MAAYYSDAECTQVLRTEVQTWDAYVATLHALTGYKYDPTKKCNTWLYGSMGFLKEESSGTCKTYMFSDDSCSTVVSVGDWGDAGKCTPQEPGGLYRIEQCASEKPSGPSVVDLSLPPLSAIKAADYPKPAAFLDVRYSDPACTKRTGASLIPGSMYAPVLNAMLNISDDTALCSQTSPDPSSRSGLYVVGDGTDDNLGCALL